MSKKVGRNKNKMTSSYQEKEKINWDEEMSPHWEKEKKSQTKEFNIFFHTF